MASARTSGKKHQLSFENTSYTPFIDLSPLSKFGVTNPGVGTDAPASYEVPELLSTKELGQFARWSRDEQHYCLDQPLSGVISLLHLLQEDLNLPHQFLPVNARTEEEGCDYVDLWSTGKTRRDLRRRPWNWSRTKRTKVESAYEASLIPKPGSKAYERGERDPIGLKAIAHRLKRIQEENLAHASW